MTRIVKQLIILFKNKNFLALKNTNNRVDKMLIIIKENSSGETGISKFVETPFSG